MTAGARFTTCVTAAGEYGIGRVLALDIVEPVKQVVYDEWQDAADRVELTSLDRDRLWHRSILNESIEWDWQ